MTKQAPYMKPPTHKQVVPIVVLLVVCFCCGLKLPFGPRLGFTIVLVILCLIVSFARTEDILNM